MSATIEMNGTYSEHAQCDLRVMCGPRYNVFVTTPDRREEPGKFFQPAVWKAMSKRVRGYEDADRWDGMG